MENTRLLLNDSLKIKASFKKTRFLKTKNISVPLFLFELFQMCTDAGFIFKPFQHSAEIFSTTSISCLLLQNERIFPFFLFVGAILKSYPFYHIHKIQYIRYQNVSEMPQCEHKHIIFSRTVSRKHSLEIRES